MSDSIEAQKFFVKFLIPNLRPAHYLNWRLSPKSFAFAVKMIKNKVRVSLDNVLFLFHRCWVSCFMLLEFMSILSKSAIAPDTLLHTEESSTTISSPTLQKFELLHKYFGSGLFEF